MTETGTDIERYGQNIRERYRARKKLTDRPTLKNIHRDIGRERATHRDRQREMSKDMCNA